jgi:hypothetical protein
VVVEQISQRERIFANAVGQGTEPDAAILS